jgi:dihydroorotate dehydrogenase
MLQYKTIWPIVRSIPPEVAHQLTLTALRLPFPRLWRSADDPFEWRGLRIRNRVGIAAGFDKNAVALRGIEKLGAGFVEVGTILVEPWPGNEARPRVKRFVSTEGIWNRLGFPSHGLERIRRNLKAFPRPARNGLVIGCNIGPHPGHVKAARDPAEYLTVARDELCALVDALFEDADFFVVNLSSPNTPGLRSILQSGDLVERVIIPVRDLIRRPHSKTSRSFETPLLVKLPPEDAERVPWSHESLRALVDPFVAKDACDGFVAVNTSTRLAAESGEASGGISGAPLRPLALGVVRELREIIGPEGLIVGSGGITMTDHAAEFIDAGSNLVEIYSGLVYRGPGLISNCASALAAHANRAISALP